MLSSEYYINNDHSKNPLKIFALAPVPYKRGLASGMAKVTEKLFSELGHMHDVKVDRVTLPYMSRILANLSTLHSLLFVGSSFQRKGVDVLLEAFPYIREKYPQVTLNLVGNPGNFNLTGLPNGVNFLGTIHDQTLLDSLFKTASMVVLPSRWEGLSHIILESFAFARPVTSVLNQLPRPA